MASTFDIRPLRQNAVAIHRGWPIHLSGGVSLLAWAWLAWRSHSEPAAPLVPVLAVHLVTWTALAVTVGFASNCRSLRAVVAWAATFRVCALVAEPLLSDDAFRFLWDGRQFARTGNPYADTPRDHFAEPDLPPPFQEILDGVNYPDLPTVYGPVCQYAFLTGYWFAPGKLWPWKLGLLAADILAQAILGWATRREPGRRRARVLVASSWCPLLIFETGFEAHPEWLAVSLILAAWFAARSGWRLAAGALAGVSVAARLTAAPLVPLVLFGAGWRGGLAALVALAMAYAPFWIQGGLADLPGLELMSREWEFNSLLFAVVGWGFDPVWTRRICGGAIAAFTLALLAKSCRREGKPWKEVRANPTAMAPTNIPPGDLLQGGILLLSPVINPWYVLWLLPFAALRPTVTAWTALVLVSLSHVTGGNLGRTELGTFGHPGWVRFVEGGALMIAVALDLARRRGLRKKALARAPAD